MLLLTILLILLAVYIIFILKPLLDGAVYVPTKSQNIDNFFKLADLKETDVVADLGSGDGRILIEFAKRNIRSTGIEFNKYLYLVSKAKVKNSGFSNLITLKNSNFFNEDLSKYNVITMFQVFYIMGRMEQKLIKELKPGTKVYCYIFKLPNLKPVKVEKSWFVYEF